MLPIMQGSANGIKITIKLDLNTDNIPPMCLARVRRDKWTSKPYTLHHTSSKLEKNGASVKKPLCSCIKVWNYCSIITLQFLQIF